MVNKINLKSLLICILVSLLIILSSCNQKKYVLVFNTDGYIDINNVEVEINKAYELPILEKEDYQFDGWYLDIDYIDGPYTIIKYEEAGEYELFAKFSPIDYSDAISLNNKIGKLKNSVTLEKEQLINDLKYKYDNLSDKEKTYITNYDILLQAINELNILKSTKDITDFLSNMKSNYSLEDLSSLEQIHVLYNDLDQASSDYIIKYYIEELNTFNDFYNALLQEVSGYQDVIDAIDEINKSDNKTVLDLYNISCTYYELNSYQQTLVNNKYNKLLESNKVANNKISIVIDYLANLNNSITLEKEDCLNKCIEAYNNLSNTEKINIESLNPSALIEDYKYIYQALVIQDDICQTKYIIDELSKELIIDVYNRYNKLPTKYQSYVNNYSILSSAYKRVEDYLIDQSAYRITYVLGKDLQNSKVDLAKNFWNSFYNFIYTYGANGEETLTKNNIKSTEDFYNMSIDYDGGRNHLYNLGDNFGQYLLKKDLNGIIENQPKTAFFGYAYQNGMYLNDWEFFIMFFGAWRIDEGYASTSNYGADTFAESWAPTVDLCKFFYFNENTSYVKTARMKDLLNRVTSVCYGDLNNNLNPGENLPTLTLRNYTFVGWYDNSDYSGDLYTTVPNNKITLYAKFVEDVDSRRTDNIGMVELYYYNLTTSVCVETYETVGYLAEFYKRLDEQAMYSFRQSFRIRGYLMDWGYNF